MGLQVAEPAPHEPGQRGLEVSSAHRMEGERGRGVGERLETGERRVQEVQTLSFCNRTAASLQVG